MSKTSGIVFETSTPLAVGAAFGGILGKELFSVVQKCAGASSTLGAVQSGCFALITLGTLIYTIKKEQIKTKRSTKPVLCIMVGLSLGVLSSFLGIGGGPINLVVLHYFFCMDTKEAAENSLYIILASQITSLVITCLSRRVPEYDTFLLILMMIGGIGGGIVGRHLNQQLSVRAVDRLFLLLLVVIITISVWNTWCYAIQ